MEQAVLRMVLLVIQMAHDEEVRKRILFIILGPVIFILLVIALIIYLVTNPMSYMSKWMESAESEAVDRFQQDWGYNQRIGMFSKDYIESSGQNYEGIILGEEGEREVVYFNQLDSRWAKQSYGQDRIGTHGCGPTSMSIVVSTLTGTTVDPVQMAQWSYDNGYYCRGEGSYHSLIPGAAQNWGLSVQQNMNGQDVVDALSNGKLIVAIMAKGHFTKGGHFIVLRGITSEGKVLVADPASVKRSNQEWDLSIILDEARKGAGAGGPFWAIG